MKEKDLYTPAGWKFPEETELYIDRSCGKPHIKQRKNVRGETDMMCLVAEFHLPCKPNDSDTRKTWALAKGLAREVLKTSFYDGVVIAHMKPSLNSGRIHDSVCVYSKFKDALTVPEIMRKAPETLKIRFFADNGTYVEESETFLKEETVARTEEATKLVDSLPEKYAGWTLFRWSRMIACWMPVQETGRRNEECRYDTGRRSWDEKNHGACKHTPNLPYDLTVKVRRTGSQEAGG